MIFLFGLVVWDFWIIQSVLNSRKFLSDPVPIDFPQPYTQFSIPSSFQFCFPIPILWAPCHIEITLAGLRSSESKASFQTTEAEGQWQNKVVVVVVTWAVLGGLEAKPRWFTDSTELFCMGDWKNISTIYNLSFCVDDLKYHTRVPRFEYKHQVSESGINVGLV